MKTLFERIGHLPTTAAGLVIITAAVALHLSGVMSLTEMKDFATELIALLVVLGFGGVASKDWGKL